MILLRTFLIITVLLLTILPTTIVLADQPDPDTTPEMVANVYRNLIEPGDQLYILYANIPYGAIPDALVTEAFIWQLIDTDGSTVLGQTVGNAFNSSGYGYNVFSMYFSAADAPTWDQPYTARLSGNPTVFDVPQTTDYILDTGNFSSLTEQADTQYELGQRLLVIADDLFAKWGLTIDTSLTASLEAGTVLSQQGEQFFRTAIFGLQAMAPGIFDIGVLNITATDRTWDTSYVDNITGQYGGTFVGTAQTAGAAFFNKGYDLVSIIFLLVILIAILAGNLLITRNVWSGLIDLTLVAVLFARIGIPAVLLTFMGLIGSFCWIYISGRTWGVWR